ncbi:hypothetical protein KOW79_011140 [Hemibagrus wyckioides]|uniref:Uncharacterized protein n=1 Tax=Hemibagrus wyckioides TaxID=337641 RepID=A0A9D3NMU2_9TELE|nr:hypothetical protein KOW79_011140 [Hemibagrus wyckioides]
MIPSMRHTSKHSDAVLRPSELLTMRKAVFINTTAIIIINTLAVVCTWEKDMKLDMALDSVDDQYIGCENEMYNLVKSKILKEELGKREKEVLIPPYEKFKITNITGSPNEMNCRVLYTLKSAGTCSNMNCELLNKKTLQVQMVM